MRLVHVTRRDFLRVTAAASAGLVIGCQIPSPVPARPSTSSRPQRLNAFLQIDPAGDVTVWVSRSDMGQGVRTSLPMIVAEELDVDWKRVKIQQADLDKKYGKQGTGGSTSIREMWAPLRTAGAAARAMLIGAAAARWGVSRASLKTDAGFVVSASGERLAYGDLVDDAAKIPVPENPPLKDPSQFRIVGKSANRLDNADIVSGKATYGLDVQLPGMLFAAVARPAVFGAKVVRFDATKAKAMPGVHDVVAIDPGVLPGHVWGGIAVIADSTWRALQARDALEIEWSRSPAAGESTATLREQFVALAKSDRKPAREEGDVRSALASATRKIEAVYELPYLAHATIEPMNCTAHFKGDSCEMWVPTQSAEWVAGVAGAAIGLDPSKIVVHVTMMGCGFGRRANPDFALEAAFISKKVNAPVKVTWTREDDMRHDYYRPATYHRFEGAVDERGNAVAWRHRLVSPSIMKWMNPATPDPGGSEVGGAADVPYMIPNLRVEFALADSAVPRGWWRSVEHSFNGFVVESFIDELAALAAKDPYEFRMALIGEPKMPPDPDPDTAPFAFKAARLRGVLELAATKAGWGTPLPPGRGRGIAAHFSFHSYVAEVAEVSVVNGELKVHRVVCAVDCGTPVNPDGIAAQMEGGIHVGLTAMKHGEITVEGGTVQQANYDTYPLLTMSESPAIDVYVVPSTEAPTGTGEPGLPPLAAAVANAIFAATGKRIRRLPIRRADLV